MRFFCPACATTHECGKLAEKFVKRSNYVCLPNILSPKMSPKRLSPKRLVAQTSVAQMVCRPNDRRPLVVPDKYLQQDVQTF